MGLARILGYSPRDLSLFSPFFYIPGLSQYSLRLTRMHLRGFGLEGWGLFGEGNGFNSLGYSDIYMEGENHTAVY